MTSVVTFVVFRDVRLQRAYNTLMTSISNKIPYGHCMAVLSQEKQEQRASRCSNTCQTYHWTSVRQNDYITMCRKASGALTDATTAKNSQTPSVTYSVSSWHRLALRHKTLDFITAHAIGAAFVHARFYYCNFLYRSLRFWHF